MGMTIKNLIIFLTVLVTTNSAHCYVLNYNELYQNIYNQIYNQTKKEVVKYSNDFSIKLNGIPQEKTITNDLTAPKIEIISQETNFSANSYKRVYIKDSKNNTIKSFPLNVQTKIYKEVLIAQETIPFGKEINQNNTRLARCEISKNLSNILQEIPQGYIAKRNFQKGNLILSDSIKSQAVILKNSIVNINFISSSGLEIKVQGHALKDGAIGETILVKSDKYNKTYNAIVKSASQVSVRI